MTSSLPATAIVDIDSNSTTSLTASLDKYYVVDTAHAAVTITLPVGATADGHWIIIQNAPADGFQVGGTVAGHNITINAHSGETITGNSSETLSAPTSTVTATCRRYFPTGSNSGTGAGEAGLTGWDTN